MAEWPWSEAQPAKNHWVTVAASGQNFLFRVLGFICGSNFDLCLWRRLLCQKEEEASKVAVPVSYNQVIEKLVRKVERHTRRHLRVRRWGKHMVSGIPQTFVHFQILYWQSLRAQKKKENKILEKVLQDSPGQRGCICIHIRSVGICVAEQKVNVWDYGSPARIRSHNLPIAEPL